MPPNDPQWGKKNNEGPPDLDEILRKLQQKLSGLLGFRARAPGSSGGSNMGTAVGGGMAFVVLLILAVWLASGFYIVDEGRRGVVLRLGRYIETTQPGPRWHIPYPIETVEVVNVSQVRTVEVGYRGNPKNKQPQEALMLTDDENIVDIQFAVQYTLKSPEDYLFKNRNPDDNVLQAAETAIREVVGKNPMDFVLSQGRSEISARVKKLMQEILDRYETGINVTTVNLLFEEASGYKQSVISTAQGDASRFRAILAEYERAPQVTRERIYLDTVQQILSATSKIIVDQKSGGQNLLYLPLDRLMQMATQNQAGTVTVDASRSAPEPATPPVVPETLPSRRDTLRSRDRESGR